MLSVAETPPFPVEDGIDVSEELRLVHRYVDLRRPRMLNNLEVRARTTSIIRRVMERNGFLDVETPQLTRPTPEGARDFLVPSRLQPGETYALPQSPQLFKQLLMVAGIERYYQIARCFRDENLRADRQPEFTQLDLELSFGDEEDIYSLMEEMFVEIWDEVLGEPLHDPVPAHHLRRVDASVRVRQAGPALRDGARRPRRGLRRHRGGRLQGRARRRRVRDRAWPFRVAATSPASSSTSGPSGPSAAAPRAWPGVSSKSPMVTRRPCAHR